jgi:putative endonuclease
MIMHNMKSYYVYIVTNKPWGVLYTGITSNLYVRIYQHKKKLFKSSFTKRYNLDKLVYYEQYQYVQDAIRREKQIKGLIRLKKIRLIEKLNPKWEDLFQKLPKALQ